VRSVTQVSKFYKPLDKKQSDNTCKQHQVGYRLYMGWYLSYYGCCTAVQYTAQLCSTLVF
jgi:hypothetical protein